MSLRAVLALCPFSIIIIIGSHLQPVTSTANKVLGFSISFFNQQEPNMLININISENGEVVVISCFVFSKCWFLLFGANWHSVNIY